MKRLWLIFLISFFWLPLANAVDFGDCEDELSRLKREADSAADSASNAESEKNQYEQCQSDRSAYGRRHNDCQAEKSNYSSAINQLIYDLDTINSRLRRIQNSCEYEMEKTSRTRRIVR